MQYVLSICIYQLWIRIYIFAKSYDNGFEAEIIEQETFRIVRKAVEELPTQMRNIILYSMKGLKNLSLIHI